MSGIERPSALTPMLRQYHEIKKQYPGTLLFFRLGDFYELFFEDAILASREMEVTLTARHKERGDPVPMCGVPHHAAAGYVTKLVRKGYRVAICEQTEDPTSNTKLVRREVVRVVTPGTLIENQLLEAKQNNYLAAICVTGEGSGLAVLDLSTGEFLATQLLGERALERLSEQMETFGPREVLYPASLGPLFKTPGPASPGATEETPGASNQTLAAFPWAVGGVVLTPQEDWVFGEQHANSLLCSQMKVDDLEGFGLAEKRLAIAAAGAALHYILTTQKVEASHIRQINYYAAEDHLLLDGATVTNLDLVEGRRSLFAVLDETQTGMGGRLLRQWLLRPEVQMERIVPRLDAVEELCGSVMRRDRLRRLLKEIADLERLTGKITLGRANAQDLLSLATSIGLLPGLRELMALSRSPLLISLTAQLDEMRDLYLQITSTIADHPPLAANEPGMIREGVHQELDELRHLAHSGKSYIVSIEARERKRTGIGSLKVKYNQVFGYFLEINHSYRDRVPADYERKQTLAQAERYTTPELKEYEARVLGAEERILALEIEIFTALRQSVAREVARLQAVAQAIAQLDLLASLAETAARRNYVRPTLHEGDEIEIRDGRHPILETLGERFIPNDLALNNTTDRLLIITGPNMGGKSVFLKQAALIVILAQMGSFVPAASARISLVDRIFTRVGAADNLAQGRSTFMVEMVETSHILNTATARSLVLLDEVGRGTATFDGLSLAWAIAEYLHDDPRHSAKTLFATHYHELTELARLRPGVRNYQVAVTESNGGIKFLRRVLPGAASKSYGLEVARLAGLPSPVLDRAREILGNLEQNELDLTGKPK
ncbi:MAG: DNA mismatch repair protein MutS, partial [Blastocatellia bacterium]